MYNIELFLLNTAQCKKLNILQKDCMLNFVNDIVDKNFFKLKDDKIESIFSSLIYNNSFNIEEKESIIKKYLEYKFKVFNHKKESGKEDLFNFSLFLNNIKNFCEMNNYTESIEMINQIENKIKEFSIIDYTKLFKYNLAPNLLYTSENFKTFVDNVLTYLNNEYAKNHNSQILNIIDKFYTYYKNLINDKLYENENLHPLNFEDAIDKGQNVKICEELLEILDDFKKNINELIVKENVSIDEI